MTECDVRARPVFHHQRTWHAIATRYDKTARNYRAGIILTSIPIWLK